MAKEVGESEGQIGNGLELFEQSGRCGVTGILPLPSVQPAQTQNNCEESANTILAHHVEHYIMDSKRLYKGRSVGFSRGNGVITVSYLMYSEAVCHAT